MIFNNDKTLPLPGQETAENRHCVLVADACSYRPFLYSTAVFLGTVEGLRCARHAVHMRKMRNSYEMFVAKLGLKGVLIIDERIILK